MRSVATAMGIDIVDAEKHATGIFDARGTLGVSREVPVGVQEISIVAELQIDGGESTLATSAAAALDERDRLSISGSPTHPAKGAKASPGPSRRMRREVTSPGVR
jgi:hypothetical protein